VCFIGPDPVFAIYSDDEGSGKAVGTGYDLEKGLSGFGLDVFSFGLTSPLLPYYLCG